VNGPPRSLPSTALSSYLAPRGGLARVALVFAATSCCSLKATKLVMMGREDLTIRVLCWSWGILSLSNRSRHLSFCRLGCVGGAMSASMTRSCSGAARPCHANARSSRLSRWPPQPHSAPGTPTLRRGCHASAKPLIPTIGEARTGLLLPSRRDPHGHRLNQYYIAIPARIHIARYADDRAPNSSGD
jgi:hypothetical protein